MNAVTTKFGGANLPSAAALAQGLRSVKVVSDNGNVLMKMDKTGHWVYGADQTEIEEGSRWAVNPFSFVHGYIAWGNGEPLAETMCPMTEPRPETDECPKGAEKGWEINLGVSLACIDGEDEGINVVFQSTSDGGKRAIQGLAAMVADQLDKDPKNPVAIIELEKEHYTHRKYGKVFKPVIKVVGWMSMEGPAAEPDVADDEPTDEDLVASVEAEAQAAKEAEAAAAKEEEAPRRRRRPARA